MRYLVATSGGFQLLSTPDELRAVYGSADSPEETLAYAAAVSGFDPIYTLEKESKTRKYLVDELEATHVTAVDGGYQVNLFDDRICGCGPHPVRETVFSVSADGQVSAGDPRDVFKNPEYDGLCAD